MNKTNKAEVPYVVPTHNEHRAAAYAHLHYWWGFKEPTVLTTFRATFV